MLSLNRTVRQTPSAVEMRALKDNHQKICYPPTEKVKTIIVENFPALGKLTALRFIEWTQKNQGWTISLPTGKTPEYFIKWVTFLLDKWNTREVRALLEDYQLDPSRKPDLRSFHFIQIDEFYPINSNQHNSFYYYVNKFYIDGFGFDRKKALLIKADEIGLKKTESLEQIWPGNIVDLSLRIKPPKNSAEENQKRVLDAVDQFCSDYEEKIRSLGGIGFFLGGIGPDGHIGFNVRGADHFSTTRLTETNYETQAAAAIDLGGIEISRNRLVITIGLQTIAYSAETTGIIIAAGETKAEIVKRAIESEKSNQVPASILHDLKNTAFYITQGAAKLLTERMHLALENSAKISDFDKMHFITNIALKCNKRIVSLKKQDLRKERSGNLFLHKLDEQFDNLIMKVEKEYKNRIMKALAPVKNEVFLHTAPHHDDIMLGYLPYLFRLLREQSNNHFFNYLTSGFSAVTNTYMLKQTRTVLKFLNTPEFQTLIKKNYFQHENHIFKNRDVYQYLDGLAANDRYAMDEGAARRFLRNLKQIYKDIEVTENFSQKLEFLCDYFISQYPGKKDIPDVQRLKGMIREWEADILWGYFGFGADAVIHSRLGFYKGDIFNEEPEINRDIVPIIDTLKKVNPTIVTVALDPEGSGPDTHYKVLQAITAALKIYQQEVPGKDKIKVWGYRNVWHRFYPAEANLFVPVTFNGMAILNDSFLHAFTSQAEASFPSYEYDGPFSGLAKQIHVKQYQQMKTVLGRDFFYQNQDSRIRSIRGLVYLKIMDLEEFYQRAHELKKNTELK
jgi:glucosamine-6-phosphate deaminase